MATYIENQSGCYLRLISDMKLEYPNFKAIDELRRELPKEWKSYPELLKMTEQYTGPLVSNPGAYFSLTWMYGSTKTRKRIVSKKLLQSKVSPDPYAHWVANRFSNLHFSLKGYIPLKYKVNTEDLTIMEQVWYELRQSTRGVHTSDEDEFLSLFQLFYVVNRYQELDL